MEALREREAVDAREREIDPLRVTDTPARDRVTLTVD